MSISTTMTNIRGGNLEADATRKLSLVAGIFFLLTFVHAAILPLYDGILNDANFILGSGDVNPVRLGVAVEIITVVANAATGVILFQVLRRQQAAIALGYVAVRIFESTIIIAGTVCLLAIVTLREGVAGAVGIDPTTLTAIGAALVAIRDWTFFFGPGFCSGLGNGLLLGYLMYRSGLLPRRLALLGLVGGPLSLVGLGFVVFGQWDQDDPQQFLFTALEIAWELSLSVLLIVKGFSRCRISEEINAERR
jgi:hypothetical protein